MRACGTRNRRSQAVLIWSFSVLCLSLQSVSAAL